MTPAEAHYMAKGYFDHRSVSVDEWLELATYALEKGEVGEWPKKAAFNLHQAVEAAYICLLLVHTLYFPRSHNIKFLRSLAEAADNTVISAWPREARADRRRFELLKRAYVEARYSDQYEVSGEDLAWLAEHARELRDLVVQSCQARLG